MKIVNIIYSGLGGHASVVFSVIEGDKLLQNTHCIIFFGIEPVPAAYKQKCELLGINFYSILKKPGIDLDSVRKIIFILKSINPKVIVLHTINLIIPIYQYANKYKIQIISVEHQSNELKIKREWAYSFLLMLLSDKVVYLTEVYKMQMMKKLGIFFKNEKISVINNGINLLLFKPVDNENTEVLNIGMLSRLMPTKDHITLIYSFYELLNKYNGVCKIKLNIAGDGSTKGDLVRQVLGLGIEDHVCFTGMIPENKSIDFLNAQNIYVHASLGETMSTSIMQAMACNKAIIASDVKGINNMLKNGETALLIPPKNKVRLTEAFIILIENKLLRKKLGKNAGEYAKENFSNEIMFKKYSKLFK